MADETPQPEQPAKRRPGRPRKDGQPTHKYSPAHYRDKVTHKCVGEPKEERRQRLEEERDKGLIPASDPMSTRHAQYRDRIKHLAPKVTERIPCPRKLAMFAAEYLAYGSSKRAALLIRYPGKSGERLLALPQTQEILKAMRARLIEGLEITPERVARERALIAFANLADYVTVQEDGTAYIDLSRMTREQAAAVSETQVEEYADGRGEGKRQIKRVKIKFHSKNEALDALDKQLGLYEKHNKQGMEAFLEFLASRQTTPQENMTDPKPIPSRVVAPAVVLPGEVVDD